MKDSTYYKNLYNRFIDSRRNRNIEEGGYYECHHIKPRCLGGEDNADNLIYLTLKEHYFAHLVLVYAYPNKWSIQRALNAMVTLNPLNKVRPKTFYSSRKFILAKKKWCHPMPSRRTLEKDYNTTSVQELEIKYNVSKSTILRWLNFYKIDKISRHLKILNSYDFNLHNFIECYETNGIKITQNKYNISDKACRKLLKHLGVYKKNHLPKPGNKNKNTLKFDNITKKKLEEDIKNLTIKQICQKHKVSQSVVTRRRKELGL